MKMGKLKYFSDTVKPVHSKEDLKIKQLKSAIASSEAKIKGLKEQLISKVEELDKQSCSWSEKLAEKDKEIARKESIIRKQISLLGNNGRTINSLKKENEALKNGIKSSIPELQKQARSEFVEELEGLRNELEEQMKIVMRSKDVSYKSASSYRDGLEFALKAISALQQDFSEKFCTSKTISDEELDKIYSEKHYKPNSKQEKEGKG